MIGETLGSYTIVGRLGAGGMGEVYLAHHTRIERCAAIKVLLPELSGNAEVVERFFSEARATSSIRHRGIVEVLDCDVHPSGRAYIVMELLEGESLAAALARDPSFGRDLDRVLAVTAAVADAIAAAHAKGIVHRDLKPDNVFLAGDERAPLGFEIKILDFGIAKLMAGGDGDRERGGSMRTRTGSLLGTPAYMSPEQCRGASLVDHRTDIYSLGCIVFEMLAGRRPFIYEGFGELISAHLNETPPTLASVGADVPPEIEAWVRRLLAKSPNDRFSSMAEVSASIQGLRRRSTAVQPSGVGVGASGGGTMMLSSSTGQARSSPPAMTTLSAHAAESVGRGSAPIGKWVLGVMALLAVVAVGLVVARSRPTPAPTPAAPAPRAPEAVNVGVIDAPGGLRVWVDGAPATLPVRLPAGSGEHQLLFRAPGFQDKTMDVDGSANRTLTLSLQPAEPARAPAAAPPAPAAASGLPAQRPGDRGGDEHNKPRLRRPSVPSMPSGLSDEARKL
ncbi:MAG TPA: serine/threonine-protein kinase [Polyangia bacterium]|jgi:hypothetical protein|nr:serine/threonine-protein kinase [Polyangia bacterium]